MVLCMGVFTLHTYDRGLHKELKMATWCNHVKENKFKSRRPLRQRYWNLLLPCATPPDFTNYLTCLVRVTSSLVKSGGVAHAWSKRLQTLRPAGRGVEQRCSKWAVQACKSKTKKDLSPSPNHNRGGITMWDRYAVPHLHRELALLREGGIFISVC